MSRTSHSKKTTPLAAQELLNHNVELSRHPGDLATLLALVLNGLERRLEEQTRAREELAKALSGRENILETIPDVIYTLDVDRRLSGWNRKLEMVTGLSPQELMGRPALDFFPAEDQEAIARAIGSAFDVGFAEVEGHLLRQDGSRVLYLWSGVPLRDPQGNVIGLTGVGRDISERERARKALEQSEGRYRSLVANVPDVAWTADVDGRRTFVSDNVARVLGYTPEEICRAGDRLWWARIAPDHAAHAKAAYELLFTAGQEYDVEYRVRRKDGRWIWVRDRSIATYGVDGVRYADGLLSDITERKGGEVALADLQEEQQRRIGRELHDSTAQTLTALSLNLAVVKQSAAALDPRAQRALSESLALAHQCAREIRTLSYLLHPPLMDELGLASALQSYADGFAGRSGIRVDLEVSPRLGRLAPEVERAVFRLVQECLTNIHRHSGSPTASIRLVQQPTVLTVQVRDEGRGMPSDEVERSARLGVGIAGMRERVRQLGGRLDISSGEAGTIVTAVLPLVGQEA